MNNDPYKPPSSQIDHDQDNITKQKTVRLKWITFVLLSLIGIPGLFVTGCGILFIPAGGVGLFFCIPAAVVCYCVFRGFRTIFSKRGRDYAQLRSTFFIALLGVLVLLSFLFIIYLS